MIESVVASGAYGISVHNVVSWAEEEGEPTREEQDALRKIPNFRLEGWSDRSEPPPQRRFVVVFAKDGEPTRDPTILRSAIKLRIDFRIIGQTHERKSIIAAVLVQTEPDDS